MCMLLAALSTAQDKQENAVEIYRLAIVEARRAFSIPDGQMLNLPHVAVVDQFDDKFWRAKSKQSAIARSLFAQAARLKRCEFATLADGRTELDEMAPLLGQMRTLVLADAWNYRATKPDRALTGGEHLLAHAQQLWSVAQHQAFALASVAEAKGLSVIKATLAKAPGDQIDVARMCSVLERHQKARATRKQITELMLAKTMRELSDEDRKLIGERLEEIVAPGRDPDCESFASMRTSLRNLKKRLSNDTLKKANPLRHLQGLESLLAAHVSASKQLRECQRDLAAR